MSGSGDSWDEMHRFLSGGAEHGSFPYGDQVAEQLLTGQLAPDDAPPELRGLAMLFEKANSPATALDLAQRASVVAAGLAAVRSSTPVTSEPTPRSRSMLSKLFTAKVAIGATAAVLGLSTAAAAATGSLPGQTTKASSHAAFGLATAGSHVAGHSNKGASGTGQTASGSIPSTGPANSHAQFGLCTAFLAGNTSSTSVSSIMVPQDSSTAFKALIAENAGSVASTIVYCQGVVAAHASSTGGSGTGKPSSTDQGSAFGLSHRPTGAGKPTNAGNSGQHAKVPTPNGGGTGTADTASGGHSSTGTSRAGSASGGASTAGSGNSSRHH